MWVLEQVDVLGCRGLCFCLELSHIIYSSSVSLYSKIPWSLDICFLWGSCPFLSWTCVSPVFTTAGKLLWFKLQIIISPFANLMSISVCIFLDSSVVLPPLIFDPCLWNSGFSWYLKHTLCWISPPPTLLVTPSQIPLQDPPPFSKLYLWMCHARD